MNRNYIGLACTGHDNAIAIVDNHGEIVFAEATERSLQSKRAVNTPPDYSIKLVAELIERYCDPAAELVICKSWSSISNKMFERELTKAAESKVILTARGVHPQRVKDVNIYRGIIQFAENNIRNSGHMLRLYCQDALGKEIVHRNYNHHLCHAATACYTSPFDEAVCMVVDGFGEGISISYYRYDQNRLRLLGEVPLMGDINRSLGTFYGAVCGLCGFDAWAGEEWKVMGLAAYGKLNHDLYKHLRHIVQNEGLKIFCPRDMDVQLQEILKYARVPGSDPESVADLAFTGQAVYADIMTEILSTLYGMGYSKNLILGGGCALNSLYNGSILERTEFENLHIFSAPADDGNAIGAAFLAYHEDNIQDASISTSSTPYLGSSVSGEAMDKMLEHSDFIASKMDDRIFEETAKHLCEGAIVAWFQGRAEFGPRALGNRSILADPRSTAVKNRINAKVKFREKFRPFAPSILHDFGEEYFVNYQDSPYMERALKFREEMVEFVPAVVHEDGTGRLQSVTRDRNRKFYDLINEFYQLTNVPLLLNTSLNVMGKPIVHTVEDAISVFETSAIDILVIDDYLIMKTQYKLSSEMIDNSISM